MVSREFILNFLKPGLLTLIQDTGRSGFQAFGVSEGGVMDRESAKIANKLVGNQFDSPVLEISLIGPEILFQGSCQISVTGADLSAKLNGNPIPMYQTLNIPDGAILSFGRPINGCRAYLAARGEWQVRRWLNSASFAPLGGEELTPESRIKKNSVIRISDLPKISLQKYPVTEIPVFPESLVVRVLPGPEFEKFSTYQIASFFSSSFQLSNDSNRMGFRLQGRRIEIDKRKEIISSGIVPGTIQITHSGQPIILMADAQTTGGYYRIANVIREDLDKLAQLKPGGEIRFQLYFIS